MRRIELGFIYRIIALQLLFLFGVADVTNAQELIDDNETKTKYELSSSKPGVVLKTIDYKMASLNSDILRDAKTKISVLKSESEGVEVSAYFYLITIVGKNSSRIAAIEYSDLLRLLDAIKKLKEEEDTDVTSKPDYLENKYITSDNFKVGYIIKNGMYDKGKSTWYISQGRFYDLDEGMILRSINDFEQSLENAKKKIDELKTILE